MNDIYDSIKYYTTIDKVNDTIEKYGVAIISNLLDDNECSKMESDMWDYLEHITQDWIIPMNRLDKSTWHLINELNDNSLLFQFWNIGHSQMVWNQRQNIKIVNVFSKFWNIEPKDLLVSFDGASFELLPPVNKSIPWYHVDHSYTNQNFKNIQSWITAFDVEPGDATLVILESSNKYHIECGNKFNIKDPNDWYIIRNEELEYYTDKCVEKHICCPKGSLVLWDSRTVHYGIESTDKKNIRCISYLCYASRSLCSIDDIYKKKYALTHLETTSHDPVSIRFKPKTPYTGEDDESQFITKINNPNLSSLGMRLAGF